MASRVLPKTELRKRIREELADLGDDTLLIAERGSPIAVAISIHRWNELQGQIEDLEDSVSILEQRLSRRAGRPAESVFATIEAEEVDVQRSARSAS